MTKFKKLLLLLLLLLAPHDDTHTHARRHAGEAHFPVAELVIWTKEGA